ncbi:membrane hypothetical protein [Gammaproteobacteria bacterium]
MFRNFTFMAINVFIISWLSFADATPTGVIEQSKNASSSASKKREDYFISTDTVIIGCTAGAAAGILAGSLPLANALRTGFGISESLALLNYLTWMGCGVGAASGVVAVITAILLPSHN